MKRWLGRITNALRIHPLHSATLPAVFVALSLAGCASLPTREHWSESLMTAASDADTWVPAAAAVMIGATVDRDLSDWAREEAPVFGSNRNADRWSDYLKGGTQLLMIGTALTIEHPDQWQTRGLRLLEQELVVRSVGAITGLAKDAADRERPDASDRASLPSGHASVSAARRSLTESNLARSNLTEPSRRVFAVATRAAAIGSAWARVEAGLHYPSDVLAGAALGNFLARFVDELFDRRSPVTAAVELSGGRVAIILRYRISSSQGIRCNR